LLASISTCLLNQVRAYNTNDHNTAINSERGMDSGGVYRVVDVSPSGERVVRGEAPFGEPISPRSSDSPPTGTYMRLSGYQYIYFAIGRTWGDNIYLNMLLTMSNTSSEDRYNSIFAKPHWRLCKFYAT